jgi:hypothetical protein
MMRQLLAFLLGISLGLWEAAVRPFLPSGLAARPLLPVLAVVIASSAQPRALAVALGGGLMVDAFWLGAPTATTLRWLVLALILDLAARHFFTNRSLYAVLGLVLSGRLLDWLGAWLVGWLGVVVGWSVSGAEVDPAWGVILIWDVLVAGGGFLLIAFLTRRFLLGNRGRSLA